MRVLVVIASFGEKNLLCLQQIIRTYRGMNLEIDIVVTAEAPKSIDLGVTTIVGAPTRDPRSLPFAHKAIFADNVDRYDLYVYTEDDIHVSEETIRAFATLSTLLPPGDIAGFMRYEVDDRGQRYLPDVHGMFHWQPGSARNAGEYVVAEFTNEHAGFFILTNAHLRHAMASGSFVCRPYAGRYDMLESAATDIYVNYGFRRVLCISHLEKFLIHHMPNKYIGKLGVPFPVVQDQIDTLRAIQAGRVPSTTLCDVEPRVLQIRWSKRYDETPSAALLNAIPPRARTLLSIGYGFGATEQALLEKGVRVTAFPLDSVVGAAGAKRGIEMIYGSLDDCFAAIEDRRFDGVLITNLVHLFPDPDAVLRECCRLLADGGTLTIQGLNADHLPTLIKRTINLQHYGTIGRFAESGIQQCAPSTVAASLRRAGCRVSVVHWVDREWPWPLGKLARYSGRFGARSWIVEAVKMPSRADVDVRRRRSLAFGGSTS